MGDETRVGTAVRMSSSLPLRAPALPALPPERSMELLDDETAVDPTQSFIGHDDTSIATHIGGQPQPPPLPALPDSRDTNKDALKRPRANKAAKKPAQKPASKDTNKDELTERFQRMDRDTMLGKSPNRSRMPLKATPTPTPTPIPRSSSVNEQHTQVSVDPLAPMQTPLIGGRYRIIKRVGEGGMGKVYKVNHAQLGKTFALKIIHEKVNDAGSEVKARELFYREARLASSLSHPNIASVVDFGEDENLGAFMVMEFLDGEPLSRIIQRDGRIGLRQACEIMFEVAEALHYIHGNKIVHCDIKTENLLLCEVPDSKRTKKQVKLLDFGLARTITASRNTGSLAGTPHYVAPERIRGEPATPSSDIYGLGVLFYELLTGQVPWDGTVAQILCGHLELEPTPPSGLMADGLDPAVEKLILRALAKTPDTRHKDAAAFLYELRTVMDMLGFRGRRKSKSTRRVVIEKPESKRDELARLAFDTCRLPLSIISSEGVILVANAAFAKFVMGVAVDVEGLNVRATPLANAWPTFSSDLSAALRGYPMRRMVEVDVGPEDVRRLLLWLDQGSVEGQVMFGVYPLDAPDKPEQP